MTQPTMIPASTAYRASVTHHKNQISQELLIYLNERIIAASDVGKFMIKIEQDQLDPFDGHVTNVKAFLEYKGYTVERLPNEYQGTFVRNRPAITVSWLDDIQ